MSINQCKTCPKICCIDFRLTQELTFPKETEEQLKKYPFIHCTDLDLIIFHGHEKMIGIYNCNRFDKETKKCIDYDIKERPEFCKNTGIICYPHKECILNKTEEI
jgi:Fe-S-cluster containining protein